MTGDLLYVNEHTSCRHYVSDRRCRFRYTELTSDGLLEFNNLPYNVLIFVHYGELVFDHDEFSNRKFTSGQMAFLPKGSYTKVQALADAGVLTGIFDTVSNLCDKFNLHSYWPLCREMDYDFTPTEIRPQLHTFLDTLRYYLNEGVNCEHFHEMKLQEMFLVLRWFYPKEMLARLFYPIIGNSLDFKSLVLENYLKVENVSQLAELSHMGRSHFDAVFKREFGMPARQWMLRQIGKHVKYHLSDPDATISDVMIKFNFNSPTHFTRFCKQQFNCTPTELIERLSTL